VDNVEGRTMTQFEILSRHLSRTAVENHRVVEVLAETETLHLQNTSQKCYHLIQLGNTIAGASENSWCLSTITTAKYVVTLQLIRVAGMPHLLFPNNSRCTWVGLCKLTAVLH
jgi:hypothetical protein